MMITLHNSLEGRQSDATFLGSLFPYFRPKTKETSLKERKATKGEVKRTEWLRPESERVCGIQT